MHGFLKYKSVSRHIRRKINTSATKFVQNIKKLIKREGKAIPAFIAHKRENEHYEESEFIKLLRKYIVENLNKDDLLAFFKKPVLTRNLNDVKVIGDYLSMNESYTFFWDLRLISRDLLYNVVNIMEIIEYKPKDPVFEYQETLDKFFVVLSGKIQIFSPIFRREKMSVEEFYWYLVDLGRRRQRKLARVETKNEMYGNEVSKFKAQKYNKSCILGNEETVSYFFIEDELLIDEIGEGVAVNDLSMVYQLKQQFIGIAKGPLILGYINKLEFIKLLKLPLEKAFAYKFSKLFRNCYAFSKWSSSDLAHLRSLISPIGIRKSENLYTQGQLSDAFYMVSEGKFIMYTELKTKNVKESLKKIEGGRSIFDKISDEIGYRRNRNTIKNIKNESKRKTTGSIRAKAFSYGTKKMQNSNVFKRRPNISIGREDVWRMIYGKGEDVNKEREKEKNIEHEREFGEDRREKVLNRYICSSDSSLIDLKLSEYPIKSQNNPLKIKVHEFVKNDIIGLEDSVNGNKRFGTVVCVSEKGKLDKVRIFDIAVMFAQRNMRVSEIEEESLRRKNELIERITYAAQLDKENKNQYIRTIYQKIINKEKEKEIKKDIKDDIKNGSIIENNRSKCVTYRYKRRIKENSSMNSLSNEIKLRTLNISFRSIKNSYFSPIKLKGTIKYNRIYCKTPKQRMNKDIKLKISSIKDFFCPLKYNSHREKSNIYYNRKDKNNLLTESNLKKNNNFLYTDINNNIVNTTPNINYFNNNNKYYDSKKISKKSNNKKAPIYSRLVCEDRDIEKAKFLKKMKLIHMKNLFYLESPMVISIEKYKETKKNLRLKYQIRKKDNLTQTTKNYKHIPNLSEPTSSKIMLRELILLNKQNQNSNTLTSKYKLQQPFCLYDCIFKNFNKNNFKNNNRIKSGNPLTSKRRYSNFFYNNNKHNNHNTNLKSKLLSNCKYNTNSKKRIFSANTSKNYSNLNSIEKEIRNYTGIYDVKRNLVSNVIFPEEPLLTKNFHFTTILEEKKNDLIDKKSSYPTSRTFFTRPHSKAK